MSQYLIAIDQGTTSTRAILFSTEGESVTQHQIPLHQYYPKNGWVEHDAEEIWLATQACLRGVLSEAGVKATAVAGIGISNQRETTVLWDRKTGLPLHKAIVWQDRRTADFCAKLAPYDMMIQEKTGLCLDPYFSATKLVWLLDNIPGARERAEKGELAFGTIDSFLIWKLGGGKCHATDATNASRTMLFNIKSQAWSEALIDLFDIPRSVLPEVYDSSHIFCETTPELLGSPVKVAGVAGDQQAALFGQACFNVGMMKCTYGTGGFLLLNTGDQLIKSRSRLLSTVAYRLAGQVTYGIEGSIFNAGTVVQWLRDSLGLFKNAQETEQMARNVADTGGVYFIPAFTGLGAPYWDSEARAAILGLTRDIRPAQIVRAGLESSVYRTCDLLTAMQEDGCFLSTLRVDGGMAHNEWFLQFLSDILQVRVERPNSVETSAQGVAYLAGLATGVFNDLEHIGKMWHLKKVKAPQMSKEVRNTFYSGWIEAIKRVRMQD